jgi:hypothetical protein
VTKEVFLYTNFGERFLITFSILSVDIVEYFFGGISGRGVKLTTHSTHQELRFKNSVAENLLLNFPS